MSKKRRKEASWEIKYTVKIVSKWKIGVKEFEKEINYGKTCRNEINLKCESNFKKQQ